jgi:Ca-activated chloride channel family protein
MNRTALLALLTLAFAAGCSGGTTPPPVAASGPNPEPSNRTGAVIASGEASATPPESTAPAVVADPDGDPARADVHVDPRSNPWLGAEATSRYLWSGQQEHEVAIWVNVPVVEEPRRLPTAVVMTVDTSGSMAGVKIQHARESARTVVEQLADGDLLALHSFERRVHRHSDLQSLRPEARGRLHAIIGRFYANGATNLYQAVFDAKSAVAYAPETHPVRRVILISDGRATVGPGSPYQLGHLGEDAIRQGVQITALGIGLDYDERALNALAERSSGRLYHLESTERLASIVEEELNLVQTTLATNASVELVPAPGVSIEAPRWGYHTLGPNGSIRFPLGSLHAGQAREFVVRVRLRSRSLGDRALLSARLHFIDHHEGGLARVQETIVRGTLTDDEGLAARSQNQHANAIVSTFRAADLTDQAARDANAGRLGAADRQLAQAEAELRRSSQRAQSPQLKRRLKRSAESLAARRRTVKKARSAPAASRPAKSRASSLELNDWAREAAGF